MDLTAFTTFFNSTNGSTGNTDGSKTTMGGTAGSPIYSAPVKFIGAKYYSITYRAHSPTSGRINLSIDVQVSFNDGGYLDGKQSYVLATAYPSDTFALDSGNTSPMFAMDTTGTYVDNTWTTAQVMLPPNRYIRLKVTKGTGNASDVILDAKMEANQA